jgi:hypothetical protein
MSCENQAGGRNYVNETSVINISLALLFLSTFRRVCSSLFRFPLPNLPDRLNNPALQHKATPQTPAPTRPRLRLLHV